MLSKIIKLFCIVCLYKVNAFKSSSISQGECTSIKSIYSKAGLIRILNLIIKILNLINVIDNSVYDIFSLNETEEDNSKLSQKKQYHEYYMGKLMCKFIIAASLITWFEMPADQSSFVLIALIISELIDNISEQVNGLNFKEEEEEDKKEKI